jgi:hypothetical protein
MTARQRNRQFLYGEYFRTLDEGVGPAESAAIGGPDESARD